MVKDHQPLPPDWGKMLKQIGATVAEALEINDQREQACTGVADLVNWEAWEKAGARLTDRVRQLPGRCEPMNEIDEELANSEQSLRGYIREVEEMRKRLQGWTTSRGT